MRTPPAPPYLLPPETVVDGQPWALGTYAELPERLDHWDPSTRTEVSRTLTVDVDEVRRSCRLLEDSSFAITAGWYSSATRLSGGPPAIELSDLPGLLRADITVIIPGSHVGGRVELRTRLVLRHPGTSPSVISPRTPGTTLWVDKTRILVEGNAARFPVSAVDFTTTPFPTNAAWALEWDQHDLEAPVLGGLRLLVNANLSTLVETLRSGSSDPRSTAVRAFIMFDVARSMVRGGLQNERFTTAPHSYDEGSTGRMLSDLISTCWPGIPVATLAGWMLEDPARLDTQLQAHLGTLA